MRVGITAAEALKPFAGHLASTIFALGFIGSGLLAVPVLAGAGSVGLAGLLGKKWGFSRSVRQAPVFYGLVALGTLGGTALSLLHVNPIRLLIYVPVINGVIVAENAAQARARCTGRIDRGAEFADAAVSMAALRRRLSK